MKRFSSNWVITNHPSMNYDHLQPGRLFFSFFLLGITELEVQQFTDFTEFNNVMAD